MSPPSALARRGLVLGVVLLCGCRFEKRPDLTARTAVDSTLYLTEHGGGPLEDSVRSTISALTEAFRVGDVTRVAQLTTRDAVLVDQEDEVFWSRASAGRLPRPLGGGEDKLGWKPVGATVSAVGDGAELATLRFQASVAGENVPWTAVESWLLVRTDLGWRLRYLHRSRGLGRSAPRP